MSVGLVVFESISNNVTHTQTFLHLYNSRISWNFYINRTWKPNRLLTLQGYFLKNDYFFKVQKIMHQRKQYLLKIWKLWRVSRWLAQSESWDFGAQRISRAWVLGKTAGKAWDLAVWLVRWPFSAALPNSVGYWQLSVTFLNMAFPFQHLCRLHSPHLSKTTRPPTTLTTEACFDADDDV